MGFLAENFRLYIFIVLNEKNRLNSSQENKILNIILKEIEKKKII